MRSPRTYRYTSLTAAIADLRSPLRIYLDTRYPLKRSVQSSYRGEGKPLLIPGGSSNPATLGAAFDFGVRFVLDPHHVPRVALNAFAESKRRLRAISEVVAIARDAADCRMALAPELLLRASWVLALTTEVFRSGTMRNSPLRGLGWLNFKAHRLLQLAPEDALIQMQQMHSLATVHLFPNLPNPAKRAVMGPTFDGSKHCSADADFIVDGQLFDLKTRLGRPSKITGVRTDSLPSADINQLLAYSLFDRSNRFKIKFVGTYSARYGHFARWPLPELMQTLAGKPLDLAEERAIVWKLLGGK